MSAHVDDLDGRAEYEGEKAIENKQRIMRWYDPNIEIKEKAAASYEERQWRRIIQVVKIRLEELKQEFNDPNFRPPLRTVWYDVVPDPFIVNNQSTDMYNKLDEKLTDARHKGVIPPDAFVDETRPDVDGYDDNRPEQHAYIKAKQVSTAHKDYQPPRWHNQRYHVEVWIEKMAQYSMIDHILEGKQVSIQVNRGQPSYTIMYEAYLRLKEIQESTGKDIVILYLGDWDFDGDIMDEVIVDYLDRFSKRYGELRYTFERVAVLEEHETAFGFKLPSTPSKKMNEKKKGNPNQDRYSNKARFERRYGRLAQIELDALTSKQALPHFKKLLIEAVDKKVEQYRGLLNDDGSPIQTTREYWKEEIWDRYKDVYTEETAKQEIDRRVQLTDFGKREIELVDKILEAINNKDEEAERKAREAYHEFYISYDNDKKKVERLEEQKIQEKIRHHLEVEEPQMLEKKRQEMKKMKDGPQKKKKLLEQKAIYERSIRKIEAQDMVMEYDGQDKHYLEINRELYRNQNIKTPEDFFRRYNRWEYNSLNYYKQRLRDVDAELRRLSVVASSAAAE